MADVQYFGTPISVKSIEKNPLASAEFLEVDSKKPIVTDLLHYHCWSSALADVPHNLHNLSELPNLRLAPGLVHLQTSVLPS